MESLCVGGGRSAVNMLKRVGERTEPCGTPAFGLKKIENEFWWRILVCLSPKKLHKSLFVRSGN